MQRLLLTFLFEYRLGRNLPRLRCSVLKVISLQSVERQQRHELQQICCVDGGSVAIGKEKATLAVFTKSSYVNKWYLICENVHCVPTLYFSEHKVPRLCTGRQA